MRKILMDYVTYEPIVLHKQDIWDAVQSLDLSEELTERFDDFLMFYGSPSLTRHICYVTLLDIHTFTKFTKAEVLLHKIDQINGYFDRFTALFNSQNDKLSHALKLGAIEAIQLSSKMFVKYLELTHSCSNIRGEYQSYVLDRLQIMNHGPVESFINKV